MEPRSVTVLKFGGTSLGTADAIARATRIVEKTTGKVIVVCSAMGGITDQLLHAAKRSADGDEEEVKVACSEFRRRHWAAIDALLKDPARAARLRRAVETMAEEFQAICRSLSVLRELTPRIIDVSLARGERISAQLFAAALEEQGVASRFVDAPDVLLMGRGQDGLRPDYGKCRQQIAQLINPLYDLVSAVVMPGFIATGPGGELITLGRSGSDYSATIMAKAVLAKEVLLFKEVDGLLTADPRLVPEARVVPELNYREATELAYYGAKILHPRTIIPLVEDGIPLIIKNSLNPDFPGTRISSDADSGEFPVKALTAMLGQAILRVEGRGMLGVPGVAAKTFSALASAGISVSVISQASSEASICFIVPADEAQRAKDCLSHAFHLEQESGLIDEIQVDQGISVIAVVGLGMRGTPGIAARTFGALSRCHINIAAIAQGSSELNISLAIGSDQVGPAMQALHDEYQLQKLRPLPHRSEQTVELVVYGVGQIGRTLLQQIVDQEQYFHANLGVECRCIGLADRSGWFMSEKGFAPARLADVLEEKANGAKLQDLLAAESDGALQHIMGMPMQRPILADLTAEETAPVLLDALDQGFHVVLANKKPLAVPMNMYRALFEKAKARGVSLRYEATVGAGLPILDTIAKLKSSGDQILEITGCLSGTLGFIMGRLGAGSTLSEAVREAHGKGFTEPHPREDLSGMDVARKALILARALGRELDMTDVSVESLYPESLDHEDAKTFINGLTTLDESFQERIHQAAAEQKVLRYVAKIDSERVTVGIEALPENTPLGRLMGTDNQVVIRTRRYDSNPLVVTGPGAGAEVTAAGVLNDILAIATARSF